MISSLQYISTLPNTYVFGPMRRTGERIHSVSRTAYGYIPQITLKRILMLSAAVSLFAMARFKNPLWIAGYVLSMGWYAIHDEYTTQQERLRLEKELKEAGVLPTDAQNLHQAKLLCAALRLEIRELQERFHSIQQANEVQLREHTERSQNSFLPATDSTVAALRVQNLDLKVKLDEHIAECERQSIHNDELRESLRKAMEEKNALELELLRLRANIKAAQSEK